MTLFIRDSSAPAISLWDAAHIFEYAASRFHAIRDALDKSLVPQTPHYKERFVQHLVWEGEVSQFS